MKRIILILLLAAVAHIACAQQVSQGEYKSWSEFKPDTTAYLNYNWSMSSKYRQQHRELPLKTFLDDLELPITTVEFRLCNIVIISMFIYVEPYEQLMKTPIQKRHGIIVRWPATHYPLAAKCEEKIPQLKDRDPMTIARIFVKWKEEYRELIEDFEYEYIVY
ncbi:MAG: hypothetical protein K2J51_00365 [Alistipes sp.]|nr:hypothetical protein [Alistipes sp.]